MATLLNLKAQVEEARGTRMKMVFSGASEAHLLAEELGTFLTTLFAIPHLTCLFFLSASQCWGNTHTCQTISRYMGRQKNVSHSKSFRFCVNVPNHWRRLAGPPITNETSVVKLTRYGVLVGLGVQETDQAKNARFDLVWVRKRRVVACLHCSLINHSGRLGV